MQFLVIEIGLPEFLIRYPYRNVFLLAFFIHKKIYAKYYIEIV